MTVPEGMTQEEALALAREDIANFSSFNEGNIAEARVDGGIAEFNLKGFQGALSDLINDDWVRVRLFDHGNVQAAITTNNHQLAGIRIWSVQSVGSDKILITTSAYEVGNGPNKFGTVFARDSQKQVWNNYLRNIDKKYFGGGGTAGNFIHYKTNKIANPYERYVN
jgi:hypothetical protein